MSHARSIVPSQFVAAWIAKLRPERRGGARALDVAMGRGRHAVVLAREGFRVFGVDEQVAAVRDAIAAAAAEGLALHAWCADLTAHPLPRDRFDLIVVSRYLQRDLLPAIRAAIVPGGAIVYETFTVAQRRSGVGPRSRDHLLEHGELRDAFAAFELLFYEEITRPEAVARLVARKPGRAV